MGADICLAVALAVCFQRIYAQTFQTRQYGDSGLLLNVYAAFRDGSGLSHDNRVTARQVVDLLGAMSRHPHAALYLDTLAEPGEDGSMRRRYTDKALVGRLQAKTGTIAGVSTLAGFIERPDGRKLAFAVLINGPGNSELIRKICVALAQ